MLKTADVQAMFNEGRSLADHLPYGEYIDGVFCHVDGSVGQVWELSLSGCEGLEAVRMDEISGGIAGFVARLPRELHVQLIVWYGCGARP